MISRPTVLCGACSKSTWKTTCLFAINQNLGTFSKRSSLVKLKSGNARYQLSFPAILNLPLNQVYKCCHRHRHKKAKDQDDENENQTTFSVPVDSQFVQDCKTLQVPRTCDESQVRSSFIKLAKIYHPDSGGPQASAESFYQIDKAYKNILQRFADERHNHSKIDGEFGLYYDAKRRETKNNLRQEAAEEKEDEIDHTTPQHRQYLTYDGFTPGSPFQREKQYQKYRAAKASENVFNHRINKITNDTGVEETALAKDQRAAKKIKTSFGMDRLVEDMIQESMARGDFDNLSCSGKPLEHDRSYNPYIDFTTHKLNQVLIDNGFAPQWILLEKEIREEIKDLRSRIQRERHNFKEQLDPHELHNWEGFLQDLKPSCDLLNAKIQKYNLVVPSLYKQILGLEIQREGKKALGQFSPEMYSENQQMKERQTQSSASGSSHSNYSTATDSEGKNIFGFLMSFITKSH